MEILGHLHLVPLHCYSYVHAGPDLECLCVIFRQNGSLVNSPVVLEVMSKKQALICGDCGGGGGGA